MPRPAKRRQVETATSQPITRFTRVSKAAAAAESEFSGKKAAGIQSTAPSKKRKAASLAIEANPVLARRTQSFAPSSDEEEDQDAAGAAPPKRACRRETQQQQQPVTSRTKRAAAAPRSLKVESAQKLRSSSARKPVQTKLDKHFQVTTKSNDLPQHLVDLVDLHRAFLRTVLLHIAHSRSSAPIDIQSIAPHIALAWGKRQVTVEDIQRCVAIQTSSQFGYSSPFIVSDYGRGKICVELQPEQSAAAIDEDKLCKQFEESLRHLCTERAVDEMMDVDVSLESLSLAELPMATIKNMDLGLKANPLLAKGQRVLSDLKSDLATKQQEKDAKQVAISKNPMLNPDGTKMSVLDRLRMKQLIKENGPAPPSGPELDRRAALNRVMDVSATLSMLSLSNPSLPRQAFTMAVVMDRLKDSLRVPVSREEGTRCIRLLATEVAPEWVRVVALGGRENVVLQRNMQPVDRVLEERVQKLL